MNDELRRELQRWLADRALPPRQRLLAVIRTVDLAHGNVDVDVEPVVRAVLARAAVAIAPLFAEPVDEGIAATTLAAHAYVASPTEDRWGAFERASTDSYPFGPGDGCLAIDELGGHGTPGAGDHGAGFLWEAAIALGPDRVCDAVHDELARWLAVPA